jgi:hypothetical protein
MNLIIGNRVNGYIMYNILTNTCKILHY